MSLDFSDETTTILEQMTTDEIATSVRSRCKVAVQGFRCRLGVTHKEMLESKRQSDSDQSLTDSVTLVSFGRLHRDAEEGREHAIGVAELIADEIGVKVFEREECRWIP